MELDIGFFCTEEEPSSVQRLGIKVRKDTVHTLLQCAVFSGIVHFFDQEQYMELGARSLAALFLHAVAAEMNSKSDIRECPAHVFRGDPIFRVFRMIIVTIHTKAGRS